MDFLLEQPPDHLSWPFLASSPCTDSSRLLKLPRELRDQIYDYVFASNPPRVLCYPKTTKFPIKGMSLLRTSRWVRDEAIRSFYLNFNIIVHNPIFVWEYERSFSPILNWSLIQYLRIMTEVGCSCRYGHGRICYEGQAESLRRENQTLWFEDLIEKVGRSQFLRRNCDIVISGTTWSRHSRTLAMRLLKKAATLTAFKTVSIHFHCPPEVWAKPIEEPHDQVDTCLTSVTHIAWEFSGEMSEAIDFLEESLGSSTIHRYGPFRRVEFHPKGVRLVENP